jgi:hypothetical protein
VSRRYVHAARSASVAAMASTNYRYELRRGDSITATEHISYETPLRVADSITIGTARGVVRELGPKRPDGEFRLLIDLLTDSAAGD